MYCKNVYKDNGYYQFIHDFEKNDAYYALVGSIKEWTTSISKEIRQMLDVEINSIGKMIRSLKSQRINSPSPIANSR